MNDRDQLNATLIYKQELAPGLLLLRVKPDGIVPNFKSGQYVVLGLPRNATIHIDYNSKDNSSDSKLIKRAYSVGSPPEQKEYVEFFIAVVPSGSLTPRLYALAINDRLHLGLKFTGTFTLESVEPDKNLIFVATGTGIAPFISMLQTKETFANRLRKVTILYGARYIRDFGYRELIENLQKELPNLNVIYTASRDTSAVKVKQGYVQNLINEGVVNIDPATDHAFLCGNPNMVNDVEELLTNRGFVEHTKKSWEFTY
jgi:ferredoxin/flavodoxin---NADP+ reductase